MSIKSRKKPKIHVTKLQTKPEQIESEVKNNSGKDSYAWIISIIGILISIISLIYGIINNNSNNKLSNDQFYLNNIPLLSLVSVDVETFRHDSIVAVIKFWNNSNQTINPVYKAGTVIKDKNQVLRDYEYDKSRVFLYSSSLFLTPIIKPFDTITYRMPVLFTSADSLDNKDIIHIYYVFESEKKVIFDKYLQIQLKYILDTTSIPKNQFNIHKFSSFEYMMSISLKYIYNVIQYNCDTKVYLSDERDNVISNSRYKIIKK